MANNMYKKYLLKVGGTTVAALAMTAALSTTALAADVEDPALIPGGSTPPVDSGAEGSSLAISNEAELKEANGEIENSNEEKLAENEQIDAENEQIDADNDEALENNDAAGNDEEGSDGLLTDPELDKPEAPAFGGTDNMTAEEYNKEVGEYNGEIDEYNKEIDEYNGEVDDFNAAADEHDQQKQEEFDAENTKYQELQGIYDALNNNEKDSEEYKAALEALKSYDGYDAYLEELEKYENDSEEHQKLVDEYNAKQEIYKALAENDKDSEAYKAALEALKGYDGYDEYLEELEKYEQEKEDFAAEDAEYQTLKGIYDILNKGDKESQEYKDALAKLSGYEGYDEYLAELEKYEQEKADFEAENTEYLKLKELHDIIENGDKDSEAYKAALEELEKYEDYDAYLEELEQYEQKLKDFEEANTRNQELQEIYKALTENDKDSDEYKAALEKLAGYEGYEEYLKELEQYEDAAEDFETESEIYDEVSDYNQSIVEKNENIDDMNAALENDLHAENVENIDAVGEINDNVDVDQSVLDVLNGYEDLAAQHDALEDAAEALENHEGKNAELGSDAYAQYLAAVQQYNEDVDNFNEAVEAYNDAVAAYNAAVEHYNENKPATEPGDTTVGNGTVQGDGKDTDWGNINVGNDYTVDHVDVKYQAAASKDVMEDGTFTDKTTQYTVTGVYAEEGDEDYGLTFDNDGNGGSPAQVQELEKSEQYDEFGINHDKLTAAKDWNNWNDDPDFVHPNLDPTKGTVSFHVTLKDDKNEEHSINVNLDANSVYAEGSYYKAKYGYNLYGQYGETDFLDQFYTTDEDGNKKYLDVVYIDGEKYYDISGQSVFVISALTCDGMTNWGNSLNPNGLDLILNLQTMIELHQSENAKTISYLNFELGKTAQAEAPDGLGNGPELPELEPVEDTLGDPPVLPELDIPEDESGEPPVLPELEVPVDESGDPPVLPELEPVDEWDEEEPTLPELIAPEEPVPTERLEHLEKLEKLDEKVIIEFEPEVEPDPDPVDPDPTPDYDDDDDELVEIEEPEVPLDEEPVVEEPAEDPVEIEEPEVPLAELPDVDVPLADVPKTGDSSLLWQAMSLFSGFGLALFGKKRKDAE